MADELPEPIFTPATKAESGHDENLTEAGARDALGDSLYERLKETSIDIYLTAASISLPLDSPPRAASSSPTPSLSSGGPATNSC
jgi:hypothetical protein